MQWTVQAVEVLTIGTRFVGPFGPFEIRKNAEQCALELAKRDSITSVTILPRCGDANTVDPAEPGNGD